jgi:hypothetical protein
MARSSFLTIALLPVVLVFVAGASIAVAQPQAAAPPAAPETELSHLPRTVVVPNDEPRGPFPPRPPEGSARTVSASLSLGPGWLALRDKLGRDGQGAMAVAARVGVVVAPEWNLILGVDHSSTDRGEATFSQTAGIGGVQRFFFGRLYLGGALALAMVKESGVPDGLTDGPGYGLSAHVGVEALRSPHLAVIVELSVTMAQYAREVWEMGGLRAGVLVF